MAKITLVGAGSVVFTKTLITDILSYPELRESTLCLYDIDPERLETAEAMAHWIAGALGANPVIEATLDRRQALEGASYVINMVQVGGYNSTRIDFEIPRSYGLRQTIADTHGIGGIFRGLRSIPVTLNLAHEMEAICPKALLINYTNPMAMIVWSVFAATHIPVVGLCHSVQHTTRQISNYSEIPYDEVAYLGAGINHIAFILKFEHNGRDAYPLLRKAVEENRIPRTDLVRAELFKRMNYFVTESSEHMAEYTPYFIPHSGLVERFNVPIDEYLRRSQVNLNEFEHTRSMLQRGEPFKLEPSEEYASSIIFAMETGKPAVVYGNVRNSGLITNLPDGCCVEVPCLVDRNGIQPTHIGSLPPHLAGFIRPHVSVQELVVRAVLEGRRDYVYQAAMLDPLVAASMPLDCIWEMVDEMIAAHRIEFQAVQTLKVSGVEPVQFFAE